MGLTATPFNTPATLCMGMPRTLEVVCTDEDCALDMFELHYTYNMPEDVDVTDFACPYCGETEDLEAVEL